MNEQLPGGWTIGPATDPDDCTHPRGAVSDGMCFECGSQVRPIVVTLALNGLPDECPECGAPAPDGNWALGMRGLLLHVVCPRCVTAVAPVRAVAAADPECE